MRISDWSSDVCSSDLATFMEAFPEINNITAINGINLLNRSFKSNGATFFVQLKPWKERTRTATEILGQIQGMYSGYPKATVLAVAPPAIPGLGSSGGFSMQVLDQQGCDIQEFEAMVGTLVMAANQRPEIGMAYTLFHSMEGGRGGKKWVSYC